MIALLRQAQDHDQLRGEPAGGGDRAQPAFEAGQLLFERGDRGIADPAVDVAVRAQREQLGRVLG